MASSNLFPAIGQVADQADLVKHPENEQAGTEADGDERPVQEIESLCMNCGEQGVTRLLLTSIPFFREVVVMSFRCEHCGHQNNEIQSAGTIRPEGAVYTARILAREDLDRQLVKSSSCSVTIPQFELTIPPGRGQLTTVEGLLRDVVADLGADQTLRKIQNPPAYEKIQQILDAIKDILADSDDSEEEQETTGQKEPKVKPSQRDVPMKPFSIILDDPAGNSFIEFVGSMADPKWNMRTYHRTKKQNIQLGLASDDAADDAEETSVGLPDEKAAMDKIKEHIDQAGEGAEGDDNDEIYVFPGPCSSCGHPIKTLMKRVNIPYFKEIIIMSTNCDHCGYRDNEVKSGSAISEKGKRITLKVEDREDLSRDILKSETCGLSIPEIELVLQPGTLGGRFTTLEGILNQVYEELSEKAFAGDASTAQEKSTFENFLRGLKEVKNAERPFTVIIDDPLANSYLQNIYAPDPDPNMTIELYDRTFEQNEVLGLNDMKVEGYEADAQAQT
ncbi:zf-ZPR1-domain-containing protein [Punctularia strigosozonata HHB-11173 SS5]|uniref:zf-ZPR1-domain-containing protein n=1 Tax=Punctularia strigosozonata (strain HHB-11173) TaxID=741275 RepID=UPI00044182E1|nr:zf-ZPR1-domain-containing protein [Punctularia strigosozonata HHB-11173 SS5]EIN06021.1 zf-ZPR1-domain-containing protein [Punctularia strigosozonata HHB-11173 SS5]